MKKLFYFIITLFSIILITAFIPINTSKENSIEVTGTIKSIHKEGINDLVFELENDKITYYINWGLENGFKLDKSKTDFIGKKATLNYAKNWTPLAPFGTKSKHITQIFIDNKEIYSEFE